MRDSHTVRNSSTICTGRGESTSSTPGLFAATRQSGKQRLRRTQGFSRHGLAAMALSGLLILSACTPAPPGTGVATPPGSTSSTTGATTPEPATAAPTTVPAYKPATAKGPAQNVPVPVLPAKAKEFSKEGLIAFAEYWYQTLGYAYETGRVAPMQSVSDPTCPSCARVKTSVEQRYGNGGWLVGGLMVVHESRSTFNQMSDGTYQAVLTIQQGQVSSFNADGSLDSDSGPTIARPDIVIAKYDGGRWTAIKAEHLTEE